LVIVLVLLVDECTFRPIVAVKMPEMKNVDNYFEEPGAAQNSCS
jgi:hypothetical protein